MRLSRKFLSDYLNLDGINFTDVASKMVLVGNEYESISKLCDGSNLVVGHVLECEKHPESNKLSICMVDLGNDKKQILCGASNVKAGMKVIVAKVGAKLPGNIEIKEAKLAGMTSYGMICSLAELGLESKYLTIEDKDGIHELPADAPVGMDALAYLDFDDEIIDFELTSNRADLLSVLGMAYEVGAIYNKEVTLPKTEVATISDDINNYYSLEVKTSKVSMYLAKLVNKVVIKESPNFIKARLIASGIRPINNVVDISNYVMLEYGQPLHFFDADKLGKKIVVRMAHNDEMVTTLDNVSHKLNSNDILITDGSTPIALAGVMGGLNTEVDTNTKNILIESAIFNPLNIRMTSKKVMRSEASNRFEKGIDPNRTLLALNRACYLLNKYAAGEVLSGVLTFDSADKSSKEISLSLTKINNVLGMSLTKDEVLSIFKRLKLEVSYDGEFLVTVPTRRLDLTIKEDLIEEIGRMHGYDNLVGKLPISNIKEGSYERSNKMAKELRHLMAGLGLNEVLTYSLLKDSDVDKFVLNLKEKVTLLSPMSEDRKVMRQSLIYSLYSVLDYHLARNLKDVNIFEIGSVYYKNYDKYHEDMFLSGLLCGDYLANNWQGKVVKADFYLTKGMVEDVLNYLGLANRYQFKVMSIPNGYHPTRSASIYVDQELVGHLGQIHPSISKKEAYVFELNLDKILGIKVRGIKFKEISKYPSISKDLAFVIKKNISAKEIMDIIKRVGGRLLTFVDVFDIYTGSNVLPDEKSLAYSLVFQDATKTLSDEEVNSIIDKIISEVKTKVKGQLRTK